MTDHGAQFKSMLVARVTTLTLGFLASVVVTRSLSPEQRGTYYMAIAVATTAMALGHLSLEQAQTALWVDERDRTSLEANSIPMGLLVGAVAATAAMGVVPLIQQSARLPDMWLLATACAGVPLGVGVLYTSNIVLLRGRARVAGRAALLGAVVQCVPLVLLGATGRLTIHTAVAVWTISSGVSLAVLITRGGLFTGRADTRTARTTLSLGLRLHAGSAAYFLLQRSDVFLLNALSGPGEVGIYSLAVTLAELSRILIDVVCQVTLARQFDGRKDSTEVTAAITRFVVLLAIASAFVAISLAAVLVAPVYGVAYADVDSLIALLVPGVLVTAASRPVITSLLRSGSTRWMVISNVTALIVNVGLNLVLIPTWGAAGCAVASTIAYVGLAALHVTASVHLTGLPWRRLLPRGADLTELAKRAGRGGPISTWGNRAR